MEKLWNWKSNWFCSLRWDFDCYGMPKNRYYSFDIFPLLQFTFVYNCSVDFLLQSLFLSFSVFGGVVDCQKLDFLNGVGIMIFRACQNAFNIVKCLYTLILLQNHRVDLFRVGCNWKVCTFGVILGWKTIDCFSALESWRTRNAWIVWNTDPTWFWNSCFSKTTGLIFSFKVSI